MSDSPIDDVDDSSTSKPTSAGNAADFQIAADAQFAADAQIESFTDRIELLAQELRARWRSGRCERIEELGPGFDELAGNDEPLLDLIYHEVLIRESFGERPQLAEYVGRFPQYEERLDRLFAVHEAIEEDDDWSAELDAFVAGDGDGSVSGNDDGDSGVGVGVGVGSVSVSGSGSGSVSVSVSGSVSDAAMPSPTEFDSGILHRRALWPRRGRASRPVDPPPGYELLDELGRGGMAVVFRARQHTLNRIVALKMLLGGGIASRETLGRLKQEARAVAQLQHPGIVQIHEVGEHHGLPYLSLEFVSGGTLHDWLRGHPLEPREAARIIEQLARTTAYAHERGIVHRDLKPANVLLVERPAPLQPDVTMLVGRRSNHGETSDTGIQTKISDFGLARMNDDVSNLTATGQVIGTPSYMAPEQASGSEGTTSPALDIYSLGAILYELLTGRPPFRGATLFETLEQVRSHDAVPPRQLQPNTPRDIETICLKCLDKSPTRRYGTALELAADLRCFINGESISARPAGWVERASRRMRRNPAVTGLIALIVVLLLGGQAAILNEAHRANQSEQAALADSRRADLERAKADSERQKADRERARALAAAREADRSRREAEAARQQAEATRREAVKHQQDAERERARAIESQVLTEVALERTLDALNSAAILGGTITSIPGLEPLGRGMLDKTLALYEELLADDGLNAARDGAGSASSNSGSSEHSSEHSRRLVALLYAGEIHLRLKHTLRAEQLLTEAATLSEQEPDSNRSFDQFHRNVRIWWNLATIHSRRDNWDAALTCLQKALSITDAALQKEPTSDLHQTSRMNILTKFAEALQHQGRSPEAIEVSNESIAIGRKLIEQNPQNFPAHSDLAAALHRSSVVLRTLNRTAEADANAAEALALRQQMYDLFPHVARAALDLTQSWLDQSRLDLEAGQLESATALARRAEELLAPLFRLSSGNEDLQDRLLDLKFVRLRATIQLGSSPGIDASLSDLSPLLAAARRNLPTNVKFRELASHWLQVQGNLLVARGDEAQARDCFEAAIEARFGIMGATPQDRPAQVAASYGHLARLLASCPLAALRRPEQAMRLADLAVETAPDDASIQLIRGIVLMEAGQHEAAGRAFERCSQLTLPSESDGSDGSENSDSSEKSLKRLRMDRRILQTVNLLRMGERAAAIEYSRQLEFPELEYTPESTDMLQYIEEVRRLPESEEAGLPADARLR